jgi:hypothetical protein
LPAIAVHAELVVPMVTEAPAASGPDTVPKVTWAPFTR